MIKFRFLSALLCLSISTVATRLAAQNYTPYNITTFAGSNLNGGLLNGQGTAAEFYNPNAVAVDSSGNVYVADTGNDVVRKITSGGLVSTLASGFGPLYGIAVDSSGNVYVSDQINTTATTGAIKKITSTGSVSVLVSSGLAGPAGLTLDSSGNLYVADAGNSVIRKVNTQTGAMTVYAGTAGSSAAIDGAPGTGKMGYPTGVAFDTSGNLYVADGQFEEIRKVNSSGTLSTYAGSPGVPSTQDGAINGSPGNVGFEDPVGIASDGAGNLYIVDGGAIRYITAGGTVSTLAGVYGRAGSNNGAGQNALFNNPYGIAATSAGVIYIADAGNYEIRLGVSPTSQAPTIQYQPTSVTSSVGGSAAFMVTASGANLTYQWYLNGVAISGATTTPLSLGNLTASQAGTYTVTVSNSYGSVTSTGAYLTVGPSLAPNITSEPSSVTAAAGGTATFAVTASGSGLSYQWYLNGAAISGATSSTLNLSALTSSQAGSYTVTVTNNYGAATSFAATLTVTGSSTSVPAVTTQPVAVTAYAGSAASLSVSASGNNLSYQWNLNGTPISGATSSTLSLGSLTTSQGGTYTVTVSNSSGSVTSSGAVVTVVEGGHLINLSVLTTLAATGNFTVGFVIGGAATTGSKPVLLRASGPSLAAFLSPPYLDNPSISFYNGTTLVNSNSAWGGNATISSVAAQVGAFPFVSSTSLDSALYVPAAPTGNDSVIVQGIGVVGGSVLAEIYDATPSASFSATTPRLINLSVLKNMGSLLTVGFTVGGSANRNVLIRAVGPTLGLAPFNLGGVASNPQITLFNSSSTAIQSNDVWGGTAALTSAMATSGAFTLPSNSLDSAMIANLAPGTYTVQATEASGTTGTVLVDLYELP